MRELIDGIVEHIDRVETVELYEAKRLPAQPDEGNRRNLMSCAPR
jgi:hypothetical protein